MASIRPPTRWLRPLASPEPAPSSPSREDPHWVQDSMRRLLERRAEARALVVSPAATVVRAPSDDARKELLCITMALDQAWPHLTPAAQAVIGCLFDHHQTEAETARTLHMSRRQVRNHLQQACRLLAQAVGLIPTPSPGTATRARTSRGR